MTIFRITKVIEYNLIYSIIVLLIELVKNSHLMLVYNFNYKEDKNEF